MIDSPVYERRLRINETFSLSQTCSPAAWVGERSPRHRWSNRTLTWVGREAGITVWRKVSQPGDGELVVSGTAAPAGDEAWLNDVLGLTTLLPSFFDPVIAALERRFSGLRPMSDGGLFEGLITAIVGQSISVAAAAVTQAKLCAMFTSSIELDGRRFSPLPTAEELAASTPEFIRLCGVTGKRAEAIVTASQRFVAGEFPDNDWARTHPDETVTLLLSLPGVGPWTAESTLLWGLGAANAHPTNDVALLRAARRAFERPDMTLRDLDVLAEAWQPARALAARLLWTALLGPAPE
ncbi:MAG: hypothetical protein WKF81_09575 [Thermomicrobiales bacterium]